MSFYKRSYHGAAIANKNVELNSKVRMNETQGKNIEINQTPERLPPLIQDPCRDCDAKHTLPLRCAFAKATKPPYFLDSELQSEGNRSDRSIFASAAPVTSSARRDPWFLD